MYFSKPELDIIQIMIDCVTAQVELTKEEREVVESIEQKVRKEKSKRVNSHDLYAK